MESVTDEEKALKLKELTEEMKLYHNVEELEQTKKLVKKNVPLSMRSYLLAYLFLTSNKPALERSHKTGTSRREQHHETHPAEPSKVRSIKPEDGTVSFYINVGKLSKGTSQELSEFICTTAGLNPADIAGIAYKQNYSFVHIKKEKADGVEKAVNGQTYKGRKVRLSLSKSETGK